MRQHVIVLPGGHLLVRSRTGQPLFLLLEVLVQLVGDLGEVLHCGLHLLDLSLGFEQHSPVYVFSECVQPGRDRLLGALDLLPNTDALPQPQCGDHSQNTGPEAC